MKRCFHAAALALTALTLAGCAATTPATGTVAERTCVRVRDINDYDALGDRHVVLEARANDLYLLTLDPGCGDLAFARGIGLADPGSRICGDGTAWLSYDSGTGTRRCRIVSIERVETIEAARALIHARGEE